MKRWTHTPATDAIWKGLRSCDITSTESSALFDMSPNLTRLELYHRKLRKEIVEIDDNDRMLWGRRLQDTIAIGIAEDQGVRVRRLNKYMRLVDSRMGASFDFEVIALIETLGRADTPMQQMYRQYGTGNFEIKCVDYLIFRDQWTKNDDGSIEAPPHIEIQVQHQLHVSGRPWSAIGVLVSGHTPVVLIRQRYEDVGAAIEEKTRELFRRIKAGREPEPSYPRDARFVSKLYGYADPGKLYDGKGDAELRELCSQYDEARVREKLAQEDKQVAHAKIFTKIGDAEKAIADGFTISAGLVGPADIAFHRDGFRNFRLTKRKEKQTV